MAGGRPGNLPMLLALAALGAASSSAVAQAPDSESHLAGPAVRERERPSIARWNLFGQLQRAERTPEEDAVRALGLMERPAVERVFLRRQRWIDGWVSTHAGLLVRMKRASDAQPLHERVALVCEAIASTRGLAAEPPLWEQVRGVLAPSEATEFDRVMLEYWDAVAADGRARAPGVIERFAIVSEERLAILGREIERSLETLGDSGTLAVAALTNGLELSEAQRSQLAVMAAHYDQSADVPPTEAQKRALVVRVMSILGPGQRDRVLEMVGGG